MPPCSRALEVAVDEAFSIRPERYLSQLYGIQDRVAYVIAAFHGAMAEHPKTPAYDAAVHRQLAAAVRRAAGGE